MRILWHGRRVRPGREYRRGASTCSARTAARALRHAQHELRQGRCDRLSVNGGRLGANGGMGAAIRSARTVAWALRQVQREWKGREWGSAPPAAIVPSFPLSRESIFSANACPLRRYGAGIHLYDIRIGPERRAGDKPPRNQDGDTLVSTGAVNGEAHRRQRLFRHSRESGNPSSRQLHAPYPDTGQESIFTISASAQNAERGTSPRPTRMVIP